MRFIKKHIALFVLGIFTFPIVFQPLHVVWHQSHNQHGAEIYEVFVDISHGHKLSVLNNINHHCLVCEYEIVINSLPQENYFHIIIPFVLNSNYILSVFQPVYQLYSSKTPRSPPYFS